MTSIYNTYNNHSQYNSNNNNTTNNADTLISPSGNITDDLQHLLATPSPDHNNDTHSTATQAEQLLYNVNGYNRNALSEQTRNTINNSIGSPTNELQYSTASNNVTQTAAAAADALWSPRSLAQSINNAVSNYAAERSAPAEQYSYPTNSVVSEYHYSAQDAYNHEQQQQQADTYTGQPAASSTNSSIPPSLLLPSHNNAPRYRLYEPLQRRSRRTTPLFADVVEYKQPPAQAHVLDAALFATQYQPQQRSEYATLQQGTSLLPTTQPSMFDSSRSSSSSRTATPMPINSRSSTPHNYTTEYSIKSSFDIQCVDAAQQSYVLIDHYRGRRNYVTAERPYQPNNTTVKRESDEDYVDPVLKRLRTKHSNSYAHAVNTLPETAHSRYELRSVSEPQFDNNKPNYYESSPETVTNSSRASPSISPAAEVVTHRANIVSTNNTAVDPSMLHWYPCTTSTY